MKDIFNAYPENYKIEWIVGAGCLREKGETASDCWHSLKNAWRSYKAGRMNGDKDHLMQAVLDIREHQVHMGAKEGTPLKAFNLTQEMVDQWLILDPKRSIVMLRNSCMNTANKEIRESSNTIKQKYQKKLDVWKQALGVLNKK